jgi:hypothetical protein
VRTAWASLAAALLVLVCAQVASAATTPLPPPRLSEQKAIAAFLRAPKVADWVGRYPRSSLVREATYSSTYGDWTVRVWSGPAGEIAFGRVDDLTSLVTEAWTGPQVAWAMARGGDGAFGGKQINSLPVWLGFCAFFLVGLGNLRRPLTLRNLDLLVLLSLSVSLWYFNHGRIFTSVPLAYPVLLYLLARAVWVGVRGRAASHVVPVWPVWLLAAATVFLAGFRIGLNVADSNVIDVGYASVIGAQRIASGEAPYGHFPVERGTPCAAPDRDGHTVYRIQTNGRCEAAAEHGDTYGPVVYEAYLPGYALIGWHGKGDDLDAARFTSIVFDVLAMLGLFLVGLRYGDRRLGVTLAFAWAAFPFTQYVSSANSNDAVQPALMIFGFWLAATPWARGGLAALASWTKFAPLLVAPLWATYPARRPRPTVAFAVAFVVATMAAFWILLLEPHPLAAVSTFWNRTIRSQIDRESPFSLWDWRQYHAGLPDLHIAQRVLEALVLVGAAVVAIVPRKKSPLQLAAFTAALLIGFEIVLTHWFYLYVAWFFPFAAFALFAGGDGVEGDSSSPSSPGWEGRPRSSRTS